MPTINLHLTAMQEKHYKTVLYFISTVIVVTLGIQIFWNYKNFTAGKAQLIRDVHQSVDSAFMQYNAAQLDRNFIAFAIDDLSDEKAFQTLDSVGFWLEFSDAGITFDSTKLSRLENISVYRGAETFNIPKPLKGDILDSVELRESIQFPISDDLPLIDEERSSVAEFNIYTDSLDLNSLEVYIQNELRTRNIQEAFALKYTDLSNEDFYIDKALFENTELRIESQSRHLEQGTTFKLALENPQRSIFLKVLTGIILSIVLMISVIATLLYLRHIINNQKKLAEIKNDFISNITHEFKTPIATISAALEGIQHFNKDRDTVKTEKYIAMSHDQLSKLNIMVERILDMATLKKDELSVVKEPVAMDELLAKIVAKHQHLVPQQDIKYQNPKDQIIAQVDVFHLENALDNLLDNAVKYGKVPIGIALHKNEKNIIITITDQGKELKKEHLDQIFEKFYRVPKGDTHDVKGFGIGLYYTKTIIEKHGGTITVSARPTTTFTIHLPYDRN